MPYFKQTLDDQIVINDSNDPVDEIVIPLAFFLTQEGAYVEPPVGYGREYVPDSHKIAFNALGDHITEQIIQYPVSLIQRVDSTVDVYLSGVTHGIIIGDDIEIINSPESDYNGIWEVTAIPDTHQITFDIGVLTPVTPVIASGISLIHPWVDGDTYISNKAAYLAAYQALPEALEEAKIKRKSEAAGYWAANNNSDVIEYAVLPNPAHDYPANRIDRYEREYQLALNIPGLPPGYYVLDVDDVKVTDFITDGHVQDLVTLAQHYMWAGDSNLDDHKIAIDALLSVAAVEAYDFTGGYPVSPYTGP